MAITYPLTWPTTKVAASVEWGALNAGGVGKSPLNFAQKATSFEGRQLFCSVRYPRMTRAQGGAEVIAALLKLEGRVGYALFGPLGEEAAARGTVAGTPVVNGASQTGSSIAIDGLGAGQTVLAGDWLQIGSGTSAELKMNLTDATANGSGEITLADIWPQIRTSPADNSTVVFTNPKGRFRLRENLRKWDIGLASIYGVAFDLEEVIP